MGEDEGQVRWLPQNIGRGRSSEAVRACPGRSDWLAESISEPAVAVASVCGWHDRWKRGERTMKPDFLVLDLLNPPLSGRDCSLRQ
jgi:hypothetical protein